MRLQLISCKTSDKDAFTINWRYLADAVIDGFTALFWQLEKEDVHLSFGHVHIGV
jgi:hypothetical protein